MAGAAALQVSLGFVLPTMLAWQLQSRMVKAVEAQARARRDSTLMTQAARSSQAALCAGVAAATQGGMAKILITACALLATYTCSLLLLAA